MTRPGIGHIGLTVADRACLDALFESGREGHSVVIACAPAFSGEGPKAHCMVHDAGRTRLELSHDPR